MQVSEILSLGRAVRAAVWALELPVVFGDIEDVLSLSEPITKERPAEPDFAGYCAICSYVLSRLLTLAGERAEMVLGVVGDRSHCWIVWHSSAGAFVIDLTATQFDRRHREVYIVPYEGSGYSGAVRGAMLPRILPCWRSQNPYKYTDSLDRVVESLSKESRVRKQA
jgi:hypothetical protein